MNPAVRSRGALWDQSGSHVPRTCSHHVLSRSSKNVSACQNLCYAFYPRKPMVKIADLVDAFELQDDSSTYYVNIRTGEVDRISKEYLRLAEGEAEGENTPDWLKDEYERCRRVISSVDYLALPSQYEINEYQIMRSFADDRDNPAASAKLLQSLVGKGAFRRFKDTAFYLGVIDEWYRYRTAAFADIAREWCKNNGIAYEDGAD